MSILRFVNHVVKVFKWFKVIKLVLNHGVLVVLLHVFLVSVVVVLTAVVKELSVTCVVVDECLLLRVYGVVGIEKLMLHKSDMLQYQLLLLLVYQLWSCLKVIIFCYKLQFQCLYAHKMSTYKLCIYQFFMFFF